MRGRFVTLVLFALLVVCAAAQGFNAAKPYDVGEAYHIYELLLPKEEAYGITKGTLLIRKETITNIGLSLRCHSAEAEGRFRDAITDFNDTVTTKWLLQPRFQVNKPYEVVSQDILASLPLGEGEGSYVEVSAVGFNHDQTRAIVFISSKCGLCGTGSYHLLEKVHGSWKEAQGVSCATAP
jgi:hypothetical protein